MSANEIELTFIRCQNCKSLMPSTAVVCGMCGFQRGESQDAKSKQRLRQQSDINVGETNTSEAFSDDPRYSSERSSETSNAENSNAETKIESRVAEHLKKEMKESSLKRDYLNFGKKQSEPESIGQSRRADVRGFEVEESDDRSDDSDSEEYDDDGDGEDEDVGGIHDKEGRVASDAYDRGTEARPKKRRRRKKKKPNLQGEIQAQPEQHSAPIATNAYKPPVFQAPAFVEEEDSYLPPAVERVVVPRHEEPRQVPYKKEEEVRVSQVKPVETKMDQRIRNEEVDGRLLGWLINYSTNSRGSAFELRVGRRFIGRQALREDDLIIQDSALSTPHSLLHVEKGQIFIQDLMSENGTFVKSANSNEFLRKDSSTKLAHGDVIRLGSYELIVCLVPNQ